MATPTWLNKKEYPFKPHYFETPVGKMHFVDEGTGDPIVFVHGNPSWSFQYRHLIKKLSKSHRCIAPDHIGFGLSDKPADWSYLPKEHAKNLDAFLESLDLKDITIVVNDWGGPIGLSYAIKHPERIKNVVINNTWLWSVRDNWYYQAFSKFVGGPIGTFLIKKRNMFARDIVKAAFGDKKKLTQDVHRHYLMPLDDPKQRKGSWVFPWEVVNSADWLASLWKKRKALKDKNILIAWGMKDIAFKKKELRTWAEAYPKAKVVMYADAGHYVSEEKPKEMLKEMNILFKKEVKKK
jgi:haloalkane dehalogenase